RHLQLDDALELVDPGLNTIHCRHSVIISRAYGLTTSSCSTASAATWPTQRRPETALIPMKLILESQRQACRFGDPSPPLPARCLLPNNIHRARSSTLPKHCFARLSPIPLP